MLAAEAAQAQRAVGVVRVDRRGATVVGAGLDGQRLRALVRGDASDEATASPIGLVRWQRDGRYSALRASGCAALGSDERHARMHDVGG